MTTIEKVKNLCKERNIAISRLERDLGYGNASLKELKKDIPFKRVVEIAQYFNVPLDYLIDDELKSTPAYENIQKSVDPVVAFEESISNYLSQYKFDENLKNLLKIYNDLNDAGREELLKHGELLAMSGQYIKNSKSEMVQGE